MLTSQNLLTLLLVASALLASDAETSGQGRVLSRREHTLRGAHSAGAHIEQDETRHDVLSPQQPEAALQETPPARHALFIAYSWNYHLFWVSLQTYIHAGFGKDIVIIDNSAERRLLKDPATHALVGEVYPTRVKLTFSQLQNLMADLAVERNLTYYFWGHTDVALTASPDLTSFARDATACAESAFASHPDWGILYFGYDWFSAVRVDLMRTTRYDTFITVYKSDCDFYPRVLQAGYQLYNIGETCPTASFTIYELKMPLDLPLHDRTKTVEMLNKEKGLIASGERNTLQWKRGTWTELEQFGWDAWEGSTNRYLHKKWNSSECEPIRAKVEAELKQAKEASALKLPEGREASSSLEKAPQH